MPCGIDYWMLLRMNNRVYSAEYFSNYPLKIKAVADSGYVFVKWLETGQTAQVMNYFENQSASFTPLFAAEGSVDIKEINLAEIIYGSMICLMLNNDIFLRITL